MEILALLSKRDDGVIDSIRKALGKYTVYPLKTMEELEDLYSNIPLNLFIIDTVSFRLSTLSNFLERLDDDLVVLVASEIPGRLVMDELPGSVSDVIASGDIAEKLPEIVERALEKQRLKSELKLLRQTKEEQLIQSAKRADAEIFSGRYEPAPGGRFIHEKVVVNFARMLTASFDMRKLFDHFTESVMEIARVGKMSILLRDKDGFRIKTHCGIDPYLADNFVLRKDSALASWLTRSGRIIQKPAVFNDSSSVNIKKEMDLLQCSVSFPMVYKGRLIGIFNIDNKITEEPFYREELEIIYVLCNYLAAAVKDIDLYHQMWYQKRFTKNILASMTSGMIAIDEDEKVTIFNQRASETLNIDPSQVMGQDLRALPSPLGDILYETMVKGTSYNRHEVTIHPSGMPLGINSYRLMDEKRNPVGAGILFSDLSDSKKLEEQRQRAEKLKAVNDLMAKIAHEVRNPLTSIQTYTQLVNEKYADDDLNRFYISTVSDSISKLDRLIDKLVTFSSTQEYHLGIEEVNDVLDEAEHTAVKYLPDTHKISKYPMDMKCYIEADKKHLVKAINYIVQNIVDRTPEGSDIMLGARVSERRPSSIEITLAYAGEEISGEKKNNLLKPLLDIKNLGVELNIPISHKIVEGHNGVFDIISSGGTNTFVMMLPVVSNDKIPTSSEGGHVSG